jgi:hypothetical protein
MIDSSAAAAPSASRLHQLIRHPLFHQWAPRFVLLGLYAVGLIHWGWYFNYGDMSFRAYDWPKERLYLLVLQESIRNGKLPFHILAPAHYYEQFPHLLNFPQEVTENQPIICRFLALPETLLSPQILLLPYMEIGRFVLCHFLLLYTLGFLGSLWIKKRFRLGLLAFTAFWVLFNFNGYMTSHLGAGHFMWGGYFLLPFFGLFVMEWLEGGRSAPLKLALVIFAIFLQGSFHMATWCWLFVVLIALCHRRLWKQGLFVLVVCGLLAAFRLIPAALAFWRFDKLAFSGGYATLMDVWDALVVIRDANYPWTGGLFGIAAWWEYDVYVSLLGAIMLGYFGIYQRWNKDLGGAAFAGLDWPLLLHSLMAMGPTYYAIYYLPIPLFNGERVTSRFLIVPLVMLMLIASVRMQRVTERIVLGIASVALYCVAILVTFFSLLSHSDIWRVALLEGKKETYWHGLATAPVIEQADAVYRVAVGGGAVLSVVALAVCVYLMLRKEGQVVPRIDAVQDQ